MSPSTENDGNKVKRKHVVLSHQQKSQIADFLYKNLTISHKACEVNSYMKLHNKVLLILKSK